MIWYSIVYYVIVRSARPARRRERVLFHSPPVNRKKLFVEYYALVAAQCHHSIGDYVRPIPQNRQEDI